MALKRSSHRRHVSSASPLLRPVFGVAIVLFSVAAPATPAIAAGPPYDTLFIVGGTPNFPRLVNENTATSTFVNLGPADPGSVSVRVSPLAGDGTPWTLSFSAPSGSELAVGDYGGAAESAGAGVPGLNVYGGDGFACGGVAGEFSVLELARGASATVTAFAADFWLRCTGFASSPDRVMSGSIRLGSSVGWHAWSSSATSITFARQIQNVASPPEFVAVSNVGTLPISIEADIAGLSQPEFEVADHNGCLNGLIDPGANCAIGVTYVPWRTGPSTAALRIGRADTPGVFPVGLSGTGAAGTSTELVVASTGMWPVPASQVRTVVTPEVDGNVEIVDGSGQRYALRHASSQLSFDFPLPLGPGSIDLQARYLGTGTSLPSSSAVVPLNIAVATQVELSAPRQFVRMGEPVDLYATVKSPGSFRLSGGTLTIVDLESGKTIATTAVVDDLPEARVRVRLFTPIQFHSFEARYSGDGIFASSSARVDVSVRALTTTTASVSARTVNEGDTVTISGDVGAIVGAQPSAGTLTVRDEKGAVVKTAQVTGSNRRIDTALTLPKGTHRFDISYSGTDQYEASTGSVEVAVQARPDVTSPSGTVSINGGAAYTRSRTVTLQLAASDPLPGTGVASMQFSSSGPGGPWTAIEPYATTKMWQLGSGDGAKHVHVRFIDGAGNVSNAASDTIVLDTTPPTVVPPEAAFATGSKVGKTLVPVRLSFPGTDATSGIARYRLSESKDGGTSWSSVTLKNPSSSQLTLDLRPGSTKYRFRARASDVAGNTSGWSTGSTFRLVKLEESHASISYSGVWARKSNSKASGGKFRVATRNASAIVNFSGRAVGLVFRVGPYGGKAALFLDSAATPLATLDLYAASVGWRPSCVHSVRSARFIFCSRSTMWTGIRIVRALSASARATAWRIHQVA
jgi:hypothetical protein